MSIAESRVMESKWKVHKVSSTSKSGSAPVWHRFPVNPKLQLHVKLPTVFVHEPPFWQTVIPEDAHSSMSKTHMNTHVLLPDCKCLLLDCNCFITWLQLQHVVTLLLTHSGPTVRSNFTRTSILRREIFNCQLTKLLCKISCREDMFFRYKQSYYLTIVNADSWESCDMHQN